MNHKITSWALLLCVGIVGGCGAARPAKYYQLTAPSDVPSAADPDPFPVTLVLGRIASSHLYREDHMVFGSVGESMGIYEYERWAEPPTEMIDDVLLRELRTSGHYRSVYMLGSNIHGDYLLRGHLYDFKEMDGSTLVGRVAFGLELRDTKTGTIVWTHYYTHDEPVSGKNVSAVAAALNRNVQLGVKEFKVSLDQYFESNPPVNSVAAQ
jgi:ABC-type uncharacterized transport system auxiliary subunit